MHACTHNSGQSARSLHTHARAPESASLPSLLTCPLTLLLIQAPQRSRDRWQERRSLLVRDGSTLYDFALNRCEVVRLSQALSQVSAWIERLESPLSAATYILALGLARS